ncbi:hypothetical protein [Peribacillus deserti]|nr:hypothetical protein [Peribacillus deserti]
MASESGDRGLVALTTLELPLPHALARRKKSGSERPVLLFDGVGL